MWKIVEPTQNVAVALLYKLEDLEKLMPPFVSQLNVPLIAISEAKNSEDLIFLSDKSKGCHFTNKWEFTENGYRNTTSAAQEGGSGQCSAEGQNYDYRNGVRGDPDQDPDNWEEIRISIDCEDQFCPLIHHSNMSDIEYMVPESEEVYHIV